MKWLLLLCPWCRRPSIEETRKDDLYHAERLLGQALWNEEAWAAQVTMLRRRVTRLRHNLGEGA